MELKLGIGNRTMPVEVAQENLLGVLQPNPVPVGLTGTQAVRAALENPIGSPRLRELVRPGQKIAIITSDITRPMPTCKVMPALLEELSAAGAADADITLIFALGSHRKHTREEMTRLVGQEVLNRIQCVDLDVTDCVHLGTTAHGTPVDIDRRAAEADIRICLGNIEYHYFAGYSGGAKAIMPGISTRAAIQSNHSLMIRPEACAGRLKGNPIREDMEEAAAMVGVDFILNVVLDTQKEIICAVAGDVTAAHRAGCAFLDRLYRKEIPCRADIVITSQGGAPKDMNLYQTQKALDNAKHAVKDGGVVILAGACQEGLGEATFEKWMTQSPTPESMIQRIHRDFQLGGHKAAAIAMILEKADIYLVSDMDPEFVRSIFLKPFASVQEAYDAALGKCGSDASVWVIPYGGSVLPCPPENKTV